MLYDSQFFNRPGQNENSQFWHYYERVAKEHDEEFLDKHNTNLDSLLIFVSFSSGYISKLKIIVPDGFIGWFILCSQLCLHCESGVEPDS